MYIKSKKIFSKCLVLFSIVLLLITNLSANAQCDLNNPYDKITSAFHSSIALKSDGSFAVWGQLMNKNGTSEVLVPQDINSTNYPGLTGTVLKATLGGFVNNYSSFSNIQYYTQAIVLTSNGLFVWGTEGAVISQDLTNSSTIQKINNPIGGDVNTSLPLGVSPFDVSMLIASDRTLAILTNNGNVWVLSNVSREMLGNGLAGAVNSTEAKTWYKVKTSTGVDLTDIKAIRMQVSNANYNAIMALKNDGSVYTWGKTTYLGNGTGVTAITYATSMTLPTEFSASNVPKMIAVTGGSGYNPNELSGTNNTLYILSNTGALYALGDNTHRQVGDFTNTERTNWVNVERVNGTNFNNVQSISVQEHDGSWPAVAIVTTSGDLYTWGCNSGLMIGRSMDGYDYDPAMPNGFTSGADKALYVEVGGHTTAYLKQGTTQFCYVGHKIAGSMGDGVSASYFISTFNCTGTPSLSICGSVPIVASEITSIISANPTTIIANGTSTSTITVQLKQANGTNLTTTGGTVVIFTNKGTISGVTNNNNGTYTAILTSSHNVETATLSYTLNGTTGTNTATVNFISSGVVPTINIQNNISAFTTCLSTASASQSFSVTASDLTANVTVNVPEGFEIADSQAGTYSNTLTIISTAGVISSTNVWVRLTGVASGTYTGTIDFISNGATTFNISLTGIVSAPSISGTITGTSTVCAGSNTTTVNLSGSNGTIQWQASTDNITFTNITGASSDNYIATNLTRTNYYRALVTSGACSSSISGVATITVNNCTIILPDVNATNVGIRVVGNLSTNDVVFAGTTYAQPTSVSTNPIGANIDLASSGTYTFTATKPGKYIYIISVCNPGQTSGCTLSSLELTVLNPNLNTNTPVVHTDVAITPLNTAVTINILANDKSGNASTILNPSSVTVATQPANVSVVVNADGTIMYTPNTGYVGTDSLIYGVCDNGTPSNCQTAVVYVTVNAANTSPITFAAEDYAAIPTGGVANGNVLTNDENSAGATLTASLITGPTAAQGTITINADGSYTFTSTAGFSGPVDIVYQSCDGSMPAVCAKATLHILVTPPIILADFNVTNINVPVVGNLSTNDIVPGGTKYGQPVPNASNPTGATILAGPSGTYTLSATQPGKYLYMVPVCVIGQTVGCPFIPLEITVLNPSISSNPPVANIDVANTLLNTSVKLYVLANDKSGNLTTSLNASTLTVTAQPANGTAIVNPDGTLKYTPNNGFIGKDSLVYRICDDGLPMNCQTTLVYITVKATTDTPYTISADDYTEITTGMIATGLLLTNDINSANATLTASLVTGPTAVQGTISIKADGSYTFTPTVGFSGPVDIVYQACDGSTPPVCAKATLHILVTPLSGSVARNFVDITKTVSQVVMNLDGSFNITFKIKIKNNASSVLDNISLKDDLKNVFPKYNGVKVLSNTASGKLVKNNNYDGIYNIDLLNSASSTLDPYKTDSVILVINVQNDSYGNFQNAARIGVGTQYGNISVISYDPTRRVSITDTTALPSLFTIPQLGIIIEPAFSPNNDGFNDTWVIVRPYGTTLSVKIFNRWGNIVYSNNNYQNDWRGKGQMNFLGEDVPEGTYFYVVEATDQSNEIKKFAGSLTIVR
jgi:gliding motility-associated-like protein